MSPSVTLREALQVMAMRGFFIPHRGGGSVNQTATNVNAGNLNVHMGLNSVGTTWPGTLRGLPIPGVTADQMPLASASYWNNVARGAIFGWFYLIGTVNLAATGNQFTHDAATFPLLRTVMGQASQPISLIPIILVTTATTVTAPQFTISNVAGTQGYVDQDGNTVVGTKTFIFPAAATVLRSGYRMAIEDTDTAIRDIQSIRVTTAGSAGAAAIYGFEPLIPASIPIVGQIPSDGDLFGQAFLAQDARPAVATAGTATAFFGFCNFGVGLSTNAQQTGHLMGWKNA